MTQATVCDRGNRQRAPSTPSTRWSRLTQAKTVLTFLTRVGAILWMTATWLPASETGSTAAANRSEPAPAATVDPGSLSGPAPAPQPALLGIEFVDGST